MQTQEVEGSLETKMKVINGMLALEWKAKVYAMFGLRKISVGGVRYLNIHELIHWHPEDIIMLRDEVGGYGTVIFRERTEKVVEMFEKFYPKYIKSLNSIRSKYLSDFDQIGKSHQMVIEKNAKVRTAIDRYLDGDLMYMFDGKNLKAKKVKEPSALMRKVNPIQDPYVKNPVRLLQDLTDLFPKFKPYEKKHTVWRGITTDAGFIAGTDIENPMPVSTTLLPYVSRDFIVGDCCLLEINVPANYPAIFVHTFDPWQHEMILAPGTMTIKSIKIIQKGNLNKHLKDPLIPFIKQFWKDVNYNGNLRIIRCDAYPKKS